MTRDKQGKFIRPKITTLDALRMLFWEDLPAPKEEEPPKLDPQKMLAGFSAVKADDGTVTKIRTRMRNRTRWFPARKEGRWGKND